MLTKTLTRTIAEGRYDAVWRASERYQRARKNDIHIPLSFAFACKLLEQYTEADTDIVLLATLLHDIGWWAIDAKDIFERGFGPDMMQSDVRFLHEREGVRLSREILAAAGNWSEHIITSVSEIIDGHDTRPYPRSLNDRLMRDADKLWRFTVPGVAIACDWFKLSPRDYADRLQEDILPRLETELGRHLAETELESTRAALMMHLL